MSYYYTDIINELFSFERAGIKPGLERTKILLEKIGNPENSFKSIHIAGTNGKGTISCLLASILQESGVKVGLFTSPHILKFNERIKVNGVDISDDELVNISRFLLSDAKEIGATFFEITTAIAFEHFRNNNIDVAIIETGMGGRFDSTNVITPILSIISQIDLDHQEYLGDSLEKIALEKAGIIKQSVPVIIADNHSELKHIFVETARKNSSAIVCSDENIRISNISIDDKLNMSCEAFDGINSYKNIEIPIAGIHQVQNLKAVIMAYNNLKFTFPLDEEILLSGIKNLKRNTAYNSRIDRISNNPIIILDVAHNAAGIEKLVETIKLSPLSDKKFNIYFAAMEDKEIATMLKYLQTITNELNIIRLDNKRAMPIQKVSEIANSLGYSSINLFNDPAEAFNNINNDSIICGSFYTIEAFYNSRK